MAIVIAAMACAGSRPRIRSVSSVSAAGSTLIVTSVMAASVPQEPAINLHRSYPVTFFTTRPPDLKVSPRPDTAAKPRKWSRAAPALMRRGPERFAARAPPIVPRPATPPRMVA